MKNIINDAVGNLSFFLEKKEVDWDGFERELRKIENINAFDEKYEETILGELVHCDCFYKNGAMMLEMIKLFLKNGYDVTANGGRNGAIVLEQLCWSSYDRYIIDCAKVLLDAGAPIDYESDDEDSGVLSSLGFKISGAWGPDATYDFANILEAYYAIVKAYEAQKNYSDIDSFHKCIGRTLDKVSYIGDAAGLQTQKEVCEFQGSLVLWFGEYPLVISNYMDMVINPFLVRENKDNIFDVSSQLDKISGAKLNKIKYLDPITFYMEFDNGYRLLFSNYSVGDRKRNGLFEIREIENAEIKDLEIIGMCGIKGVTYSSHVTDYEERVLTLICENGVYCIFSDEREDDIYSIGVIKCSAGLTKGYVRKFPISEITRMKEFKKKDKLVGLRLRCREGYLYIKTDEYYDLNIMLSEKEFDINEHPLLWEEVGIHMDFTLLKKKIPD